MGIVHVELHAVEKVLHATIRREREGRSAVSGSLIKLTHSLFLGRMSIDEVLVATPNDNLTSDGDVFLVLIAGGALGGIVIVKGDGNAGLGDSSLPLLVY